MTDIASSAAWWYSTTASRSLVEVGRKVHPRPGAKLGKLLRKKIPIAASPPGKVPLATKSIQAVSVADGSRSP